MRTLQGTNYRHKEIRFSPIKRNHLCFLVVLLILCGCSAHKTNLTYFNDLKQLQSGSISLKIPEVKIVPDDVLSIGVTSIRPEATAIFNGGGTQHNYRVDSRGDITFPVLGKIHVEGMTTDQLSSFLHSKIEETVVDPFVSVDLVNFRIEVLGEVNRPGVVAVNKERFTIIDALAAVGDLTPYGERDNILLLRQEGEETKFYHLNLNDSRIIGSPEFYLRQNDVVIVEPNNIKKDNSKYNMNNAYKLQVISTIVSASSVVASLAIALAVK